MHEKSDARAVTPKLNASSVCASVQAARRQRSVDWPNNSRHAHVVSPVAHEPRRTSPPRSCLRPAASRLSLPLSPPLTLDALPHAGDGDGVWPKDAAAELMHGARSLICYMICSDARRV